jgi:transketolase
LAVHGFLDKEELCNNYGQDGTVYFSHVSHKLNGVEMSSGSLGHGLPVACGIALNGKVKGLDYDTYVLTGDGELDEGSCWEAIMFAAQQHLSHLCLIVDYNKIQSLGNVADICDLSSLADKFRAFNWNVIEIDGHNYDEIAQAIDLFQGRVGGEPTVIIANTIKGKGVSYMEGELLWHYRNPNDEQLKQALEELA